MATAWQLQDAKNRFSEVVDEALQSGPQTVTRRGEPVARTLVHEFAHYLYSCGVSASHCDLDCCPQGLAAWFYARTRAYLGAPEVQADAGVDTDFVDVTHTYSSDCDDYSSSGKAISFDFTFTNPGVAGDESAFTLDGVSYPSSGLCDPTLSLPPFAGLP